MPTTYLTHQIHLLVAGEAQDRRTAVAAESLARRMAASAAGALAFSRTGDPAAGEFADAVVIKEFGERPSSIGCSAE